MKDQHPGHDSEKKRNLKMDILRKIAHKIAFLKSWKYVYDCYLNDNY